MILDDFKIPAIKALKNANSGVELKNPYTPIDLNRLVKGTVKKLLLWARNRKNNEQVRLKLPIMRSENYKKSVIRQKGYFYYESCNRRVDFTMLRYKLELDVSNDMVVMFEEIVTALIGCSTWSLMDIKDESADGHMSLPPAISNLIGTTQVMEIKSHSYYEYGSFESFTCYKINPIEGDKVYFSSTSSTMILDDFKIPAIKALKNANSGVELKNPYTPIDLNRLVKGTVKKLLLWARNRKNNEQVRLKLPIMRSENYKKSVIRQKGYFYYESCNRRVDFTMLRYKLELDVSNDMVVMFEEIVTALIGCSTWSLMDIKDESADGHMSLPPAISNLIGTTQVMEIKSHSYYEYGSFESFTCYKINPIEGGEDSVGSSMLDAVVDVQTPKLKRLLRAPSVATLSKPSEPRKTKILAIMILLEPFKNKNHTWGLYNKGIGLPKSDVTTYPNTISYQSSSNDPMNPFLMWSKNWQIRKYQALKRKPVSVAQARKNMMIYLKNMAGFKMDFFKGMSYEEIRPLFEEEYNKFQTLFKEGPEIDAERIKAPRKRIRKEKDAEELKRNLKIVPDDEDDIFVNVTPLSSKPPTIMDYKIYNEGEKDHFQIIRANGNHQMYLAFSTMLKNFDKEDLEVLWKIVKDMFKELQPKEVLYVFLWHTLKVMFEHTIEDIVWKLQKGLKGLARMYPLTNYTLHQMFNKVRLQVDYEVEMAYDLLRLFRGGLLGYKVFINLLLVVIIMKKTLSGASVSVMPLLTYLNLGLGELAHSISRFVFLVDFIILDMLEDVKVPLILERPFLSTAHAKIDVFKRTITLRVGDEKIIFRSMKPASSMIKRVYMLSLRECMELDLEARLMGETLVLNRSLDLLYKDYIELNDLNVPLELKRDQVNDLMPTIEEGEAINEPLIDIIKTKNNESFDEYPSFCNFDRKIHIDCAYNLRFSCMIVVENMDGYQDQDMGDLIFGEPFCKASCVVARRFDGLIIIHNGNDNVTYQMARSHPRFKHLSNAQCNKINPLLKDLAAKEIDNFGEVSIIWNPMCVL
nr:hypothetical protein [Tanacetum cinerariifolium]